jgi:dihydroflavonol-4-reductase
MLLVSWYDSQDYHEWRQLEMRILVTGSTGLLGNNLVRQAIEDGHEVVALVRTKERPKALSDLDVQLAFGDVTDLESVLRASHGVDAILHSAAQIHLGWKERELSHRVNVQGTQAIVQAAKRERARLVHVSTVNTLAIGNREGTVDEDTQHDGQVPCTYVVSKRQAEQVTIDAAEDGLEACIVHPGFMLGPWDWKPSSGRMLLEVGKRWTPLAPSGGCSVCDVRDVARGVLLAMERGASGRHYILAGENMTYLQLWSKIAKAWGKQPPLTIMRWPARVAVGLAGDLVARMRGIESDINSAALKMSSQFHCYSSERARDELGYSVRPADESIADARAWFKDYGYLNP